VGKQTEVFLRFSTVAGEKGAADADRLQQNQQNNLQPLTA
jgi:catalase